MREQELGEVAVEVKDDLEVAVGGATAMPPRWQPSRIGRWRLGLAASERTKAKRGGASGETVAVTRAEPRRKEATADAAGGSRRAGGGGRIGRSSARGGEERNVYTERCERGDF
jgi:hypothetical protein